MDVIQCYVPTNDNNEDVEEEFYRRLSTFIQNCLRRKITVTMGDFNDKIGIVNRGDEEITERHGLGVMNDNGERFAYLCA